MVSLAFIIVFIFCLATAVAAILLSHHQLSTYNSSFHKFYFYYLVAFYAFSTYGIWGQIFMRVLLSGKDLQLIIVENVANFLPVLGVPFLFVSWMMLVSMTYSLFDSKVKSIWNYVHALMLLAVFAGSWWIYIFVSGHSNLASPYLKFTEMVVLLLFELFYFIVLGIVFLRLYRQHFLKGAKNVSRFWLLLNLGVVIRVACLALATINDWTILPAILLYFASNFVPFIYLRNVSDLVFDPVKAAGTDSDKMQFIFQKFKITKREREIILHICDGKSNQQIADDLFISLQTVKDHTHRIYSKIGIKSRMQLVQKLNA